MNRVVIVTGAGSDGGIGDGIVRRLVEAGDRVALLDVYEAGIERNAARLSGLAGTAAPYACDVGSRAAVIEVVARVEQDLGSTWGLVNAAVAGPVGGAEEQEEESWRHGLDVSVSGALWLAQAVFPQMKARGAGRIVNFGSEASDQPDDGVPLNYVVAKGAIRSLTRGLAREWGRYGITVNTVWPIAATKAQRRWIEANPEAEDAMLAQAALHRFGEPFEDIAPVVQFLLGNDARFITGATITANGGRAMP